jgi:hypothetical protein
MSKSISISVLIEYLAAGGGPALEIIAVMHGHAFFRTRRRHHRHGDGECASHRQNSHVTHEQAGLHGVRRSL